MNIRPFKKMLVANRGEIATRIFRAGSELKIRTVGIYTYEDRYSLHRFKADEAYQIGDDNDPLKPYLDIDSIVNLALQKKVDAIHPGYGFLSENVEFAQKCEESGIAFIGPRPDAMRAFGSKIEAKRLARSLGVPVIEDSQIELTTPETAEQEARRIGYPVVLKASAGGGGRGMRIVRNDSEITKAFNDARNEALRAFGNAEVFIEKYVEDPKHIEVQLLGDHYGGLIHLFERDCSVQRRFQKVIEIAPAPKLDPKIKTKLYEYALKLGRSVQYSNAGTVEFLVDRKGNPFFIEVNPRIQVEHTVTEEVTGVDIVRSQILIAQGHKLEDKSIFLKKQSDVRCSGYAVQCRITTEDPESDFVPDFGKIIAYRSAGGFGIRLDEGSAYPGVSISPFFDSMLVKVTASGRTLWGACERLERALSEFRVRGVKTNIPFLMNVISHPDFIKGRASVNFIANNPELLKFPRRRDRATRILTYLADVTVNGNPDVKDVDRKIRSFRTPKIPSADERADPPSGTRQRLQELGPDRFSKWLRHESSIHYTDTTFRDAHQSLLATRVRTTDLVTIANGFARNHPEIFSMEVWGGATFDVALRFLHECPWERLQLLRQSIPNILLQMLFRGSNAVGYSRYPENLIVRFIEKAADEGIDIFRIFDSMNLVDSMRLSIKTVRERTQSLAEACICYTGDISDGAKTKYTLPYYLDLARALEDEGAHILCIKDMTGLLKPRAAEILIPALREAVEIPIHLHTHDTSSIQSATYLSAVNSGVDVIDVALSSMSGLTSQPNFNSVVAMLRGHPRELPVDLDSLNAYSRYWEAVREFYFPFESGLKAGTADVYRHEIPGGQYSNLRPQARALGLEDKFEAIIDNYISANKLLGDLIKVTPSSKVVGDLALYMTSNNLTADDIIQRAEEISFPESVKGFFRGEIGTPYGGFPEPLRSKVLRGEEHKDEVPLPPVDFTTELSEFEKRFKFNCSELDFLSYKLYPKVFEDYFERRRHWGRVSPIPTPSFFYGMQQDEEILVEIAPGKSLIIKFLYASDADERGYRTCFFKLNGQTRGIDVLDKSVTPKRAANRKALSDNEIGSPLQGKISKILVRKGESVEQGSPLFVIEAMKMETTCSSPRSGKVKDVELPDGAFVSQDDLVLSLE